MEQQLVVSHMLLLYFQWGHPAATDDRPEYQHDEYTAPSRAPQNTKKLGPLCTAPDRFKDAGETLHNRRRLLGSTGFTG